MPNIWEYTSYFPLVCLSIKGSFFWASLVQTKSSFMFFSSFSLHAAGSVHRGKRKRKVNSHRSTLKLVSKRRPFNTPLLWAAKNQGIKHFKNMVGNQNGSQSHCTWEEIKNIQLIQKKMLSTSKSVLFTLRLTLYFGCIRWLCRWVRGVPSCAVSAQSVK